MKKITYILAIIYLFVSCNFSSNTEEEKLDTKGIKQKFIFENAPPWFVEIYLEEDFSFINLTCAYGCTGGFTVKEILGEYKIDSNYISFVPKKLIWKEDCCDEHYFNTTKIFDTVDYHYSDSTKIQLGYWHIKKDNFEFLISEASFDDEGEFYDYSSNFIALANLYNSNSKEKICSYIFCNIDTNINIRDIISKENIPKNFQKFFFDAPIEITVKNAKVNKELYPIYQLTSDRINDIFIGMKFYSKKYPYSPITIIEKKDGYLIAKGDYLFYFNTKLRAGAVVKSEK